MLRLLLITISLFLSYCVEAQSFSIFGKVADEKGTGIASSGITIGKDFSAESDSLGRFQIVKVTPGRYAITIRYLGYETYEDSITVTANTDLGTIRLQSAALMLDEVKILQKVLAVTQKDDTVEYNSSAFKVNPDADGADLVKKMPAIELNGKQIMAQGEQVVKVLVDGKPFFGNDPYAALKNLPAYVIDKVQVYNEKSDQERFTGFSEGATSKTVNIITKPGMTNSIFGNVYAGGGTDGTLARYGTGTTLNKFAGDKRITLTGQLNNINAQNFTDQNPANSNAGAGITTTRAAGLNYSDKWGRRVDVSGSYALSETATDMTRELRKIYVLSRDSGQVYNERNPSVNNHSSHRFNGRLTLTADSMNALIWTPAAGISRSSSNNQREGATDAGLTPVNRTDNSTKSNNNMLQLSSNLLYTHKFHKKGRTFSLSANAANNHNDGTMLQMAENIFYTSPVPGDTINQRSQQQQTSWNGGTDAVFTEPVGKNGQAKLQYTGTYQSASSEKNTYDYSYADGTYTLPDSLLSNSLNNANMTHKAGASYRVKFQALELSAGLNFQSAVMSNDQLFPSVRSLAYRFENWLPTASVNYKFTKKQNLQLIYSTSTQMPSVSQLQSVINNADPLHLSMGNPTLQQPYSHSLVARFNTSSKGGSNNLSAYLNGRLTQHYITSASVVAYVDTMVLGIALPRGTQLTIPQNVDNYTALNANINYGMPLKAIKCRVNVGVNASWARVPAIINNSLNYQFNNMGGVNVSVNSNINERVDFSVSSGTNIVSNVNSLNPALNNQFISESLRGTLDLIVWKGLVFNTAASYQLNKGLSSGYDQDFLLWNMSIGKKFFKRRQADIRFTVFDLLNNNNSIQHIVTETYIQDSRSNILQRYYLLVFTYKILPGALSRPRD
jgi:hypothetical protein